MRPPQPTPRRTPLRRGMPVEVRWGDLRASGTIDLVRPEQLVVVVERDLPGIGPGVAVTLTGAGIGRVPARVELVDGRRISMFRPEPTRSTFRSRRREERVPVDLAARVTTPDGAVVGAVASDVSSGGARLVLEHPHAGLSLGHDATITIAFDEGHEVHVRATVRFLGRGEHPELGVQFRLMSAPSRALLLEQLSRARTPAPPTPEPVPTVDGEPTPTGPDEDDAIAPATPADEDAEGEDAAVPVS